MANQIVPDTVFSLADEFASEAAQFKVCLGLMYESLQVNLDDVDEEVSIAFDRIHFLTSTLDRMQKRINVLSAAAYDMARTEQAAA